ncbi:hypothetical protein Tco_0810130 [Tanacetum coccineum]
MRKVIKGEFKKLEDLNEKDVSLACNTSLETQNKVMIWNLVQVSHEADDDMGYDLSDVVFTEWLRSKIFNYKTMDHYTKKALWVYWIRRDDEAELTNEEFFDNEDEVAKTYDEYKDDWIYEWNRDIPWVDEKPWTDTGVWTEPTLVKHYLLMDYEIKEQALRNKAIMEGLISDDESCNDGWRRLESHEIMNCRCAI